MDTSLTATAGPPAARSLHEICQAARRGSCGPFCGALPGDVCVFTTAPVSAPVTRGTPMQAARGYHASRFASAQSHGLISAAEFAAVTGAGSFAPAAVIYDSSASRLRSGAFVVLNSAGLKRSSALVTAAVVTALATALVIGCARACRRTCEALSLSSCSHRFVRRASRPPRWLQTWLPERMAAMACPTRKAYRFRL